MLRFRLLRYLLLIFGALGLIIVAKNLLVLYTLSPQPAAIREVRQLVLFSTVLILLLIAVAIVLLSRLISDRLHRLVAAINEVKNGGYPFLVVSGDDELSDLTRGFNQMVEELRTRDDKLKNWAGRRETELARLSQSLEVERGKLETVLQSIGEGVVVLDNENKVLMSNRRVAEIFAIRPEDMSGKDLGSLISQVRHRLVDPDKVDRQFQQLQRNTGSVDEIVLSLGDLARHERERRQNLPSHAPVITNDDVSREQILSKRVPPPKSATMPPAPAPAPSITTGMPATTGMPSWSAGDEPGFSLGAYARRLRRSRPAPAVVAEAVQNPRAATGAAPQTPNHPAEIQPRTPAPPLDSTVAKQRRPLREQHLSLPRQRIVQVRPGDSLWSIARHHFGDGQLWIFIWERNPEVMNPDRIRIGQPIRLPSREAAVAALSNLSRPPAGHVNRQGWNGAKARAHQPKLGLFRWCPRPYGLKVHSSELATVCRSVPHIATPTALHPANAIHS